jgi:thiol:disulfide interchange protein DsbD
MNRNYFLRVLLFSLTLALLPSATRAQSFGDLAEEPKVAAVLMADTVAFQPGVPFRVGVKLTMKEKWHTYWAFPGDSGSAPRVEWDLPQGATVEGPYWPLPHRLVGRGDVVTYTYEGEVLLPYTVTLPASTEPVNIKGLLKWFACERTCIPGETALSLTLPAGTPAPANTEPFSKTDRLLPQSTPAPFAASWRNPAPDILEVSLTGIPDRYKIEVMPMPPKGIQPDGGSFQRAGDSFIARFKLDEPLQSAAGWRALVVLEDSERKGWEIAASTLAQASATAAAASEPAPSNERPLLMVLLSALLGGLIMNFMPCVLPVIALKVASFSEHATKDPQRSFRMGLAFTGGALVFFLGLALGVIALRSAGKSFVWGFQFQDPWMLSGLVLVVFLFGLNLLGVFEIVFQGDAADRMGEMAGKGGYTGAFFQGMFTTLLGTSCTAPFLGATLGFAVTQPAPIVLLLFTAVCLGMSSPYLLLSANPNWVRFLPKPGMWMERLKQLTGFIMLTVAVWLLGVLGDSRGADAAFGLSATLLAAGFGAWLLGVLQNRVLGWLALAGAIALGGSTFLAPALARATLAGSQSSASQGILSWEPFTEQALAAARNAGEPVFVDFTAAWCANCKYNEKTTLETPEIAKAFAAKKVRLLKADWTTEPPHITAFLRKFQRISVPFYLLYHPGKEAPEILPELLSKSLMLETLSHLP